MVSSKCAGIICCSVLVAFAVVIVVAVVYGTSNDDGKEKKVVSCEKQIVCSFLSECDEKCMKGEPD